MRILPSETILKGLTKTDEALRELCSALMLGTRADERRIPGARKSCEGFAGLIRGDMSRRLSSDTKAEVVDSFGPLVLPWFSDSSLGYGQENIFCCAECCVELESPDVTIYFAQGLRFCSVCSSFSTAFHANARNFLSHHTVTNQQENMKLPHASADAWSMSAGRLPMHVFVRKLTDCVRKRDRGNHSVKL